LKGEKKKRKQDESYGGELTGTVSKVFVALPQEDTPEPRIKKMKKPNTSEKVDMAQTDEGKEKHA